MHIMRMQVLFAVKFNYILSCCMRLFAFPQDAQVSIHSHARQVLKKICCVYQNYNYVMV